MDDLTGLIEYVKTEKGITLTTDEELMSYVTEYELWKQRN